MSEALAATAFDVEGELEGALIRLAAYASLSKKRIDLEFAQETLGAAITRPREVITVGPGCTSGEA